MKGPIPIGYSYIIQNSSVCQCRFLWSSRVNLSFKIKNLSMTTLTQALGRLRWEIKSLSPSPSPSSSRFNICMLWFFKDTLNPVHNGNLFAHYRECLREGINIEGPRVNRVYNTYTLTHTHATHSGMHTRTHTHTHRQVVNVLPDWCLEFWAYGLY